MGERGGIVTAIPTSQLLTTLGFTVLLVVGALLSIVAYRSLRRMDDVLLKTRMYMNRRRLFAGFLSLALAMVAILAIAVVQLAYYVALNDSAPAAFGTVVLALFFGLLSWAFYNFWALAKTPSAVSPSKPE